MAGALSVLVAVALLALSAAAAFAAAPEAPTTQPPTEVKAESAFLHGILDPGKEGTAFETGTYQFVYKVSKTECKGESKAPEPPAMSLGGGKEEVSHEVTGLKPHTEYTVCLVAHNETGTEETEGSKVTFKTALPPEVPETQEPTALTATTATLRGILNPKAPGDPGTYQFIYRESATECFGEHELQAPEPPAAATGALKEQASAPVEGLLPGTTYTLCLIARNEAGEQAVSPPQTFTTPRAAPAISTGETTKVTATEATLSAQINPGGLSTTYRLEYGTSTEYGESAPEESLGAGRQAVPVQFRLTELRPDTTYHARVLATNPDGPAQGTDIIFTTLVALPSGAPPAAHCANTALAGFDAALPDCRGYELVSSAPTAAEPFPAEVEAPNAGGSPFVRQGDFVTGLPFRAAADGASVTYAADSPATGGNGSAGAGFGNQWFASRATGSWSAHDISQSPGPTETGEESSGTTYVAFSSNLDVGILGSHSQWLAAHAEPAGAPNCQVLYASHGIEARLGALFSVSNVPGHCGGNKEPVFAGGSADYTHRVFQTSAALTPDTVESNGNGEENLYEWYAGGLRTVNVLPNGAPDPNATIGGPGQNFTHAISEDGRRIFWTDLATTKAIYVREDAHTTVQVSAGPATYLAATPDGRRVLYSEGGALWRFDVEAGTREQLPAAGSAVQGLVGASSAGDYVYFVSGQALTSGAPAVNCAEAIGPEGTGREQTEEETGQLPAGRGCNLYVFHDGSPVKFVATLAPKDNEINDGGIQGDPGLWKGNRALKTGQVTADGHQLVFESSQQLTGYDNSGLESSNHGSGLEVFRYSADSNHIACLSCDPRGAPPIIEFAYELKAGTFLPSSNSLTYMPRWISSDGNRVFFDTLQRLVPADTNEALDVYEWEREGSGTCLPQSPARASGGCIALLSGGVSPDYSYFVDSSATGDDVFFTSVDQLAPQAKAHQVSLFDARVGGGTTRDGLGCAGSACPAPPASAQPFASPPTEGAQPGLGNFLPSGTRGAASPSRAQKLAKAIKTCRQHYRAHRHRRALCEARVRRQYGARAARGRATRSL